MERFQHSSVLGSRHRARSREGRQHDNSSRRSAYKLCSLASPTQPSHFPTPGGLTHRLRRTLGFCVSGRPGPCLGRRIHTHICRGSIGDWLDDHRWKLFDVYSGRWAALPHINLGSFSGASAFDIVDDDLGFGGPAYNRSSNSLDAPLWDLSESPGAQLVISSQGSWEVSAFVGGRFSGTYAISPAIAAVPEPNTFALLVTAVGLLGLTIRRNTHSAMRYQRYRHALWDARQL